MLNIQKKLKETIDIQYKSKRMEGRGVKLFLYVAYIVLEESCDIHPWIKYPPLAKNKLYLFNVVRRQEMEFKLNVFPIRVS